MLICFSFIIALVLLVYLISSVPRPGMRDHTREYRTPLSNTIHVGEECPFKHGQIIVQKSLQDLLEGNPGKQMFWDAEKMESVAKMNPQKIEAKKREIRNRLKI